VTHVVPPSVKEAIISRTPADAQAALEARIAGAFRIGREAGLREAAEIGMDMSGLLTRDAILAKIKETTHD